MRLLAGKIATITSLALLFVVLPLFSACGDAGNTRPVAERTATEEADVLAAAGTCVACHSSEDLLKETVAPIEEKSEEPAGEG